MGYQPNLSTGVWVGYPESNAIEMTSVHGITVAGGTFPADIWNAFHLNAGIPCEDFPVPEEPIEWSSFFGSYTTSEPTYDYSDYSAEDLNDGDDEKKNQDGGAGGGEESYDPDLYAPGAGQEPAPAPTPSTPAPDPSPPAGGGGGTIGGGQPTGGIGGGT
jgi:penicillin-binding protein 1A